MNILHVHAGLAAIAAALAFRICWSLNDTLGLLLSGIMLGCAIYLVVMADRIQEKQKR